MKGSEFVFDYVDLLYNQKNKKATKNPINKKDNECFQYATTVQLSHEEIKKIRKKYKKFYNSL